MNQKIVNDAPLIAYNAIKYYELSNVRRHRYKFSFENMLNTRSNSSMYLLYTYARISSVLTKATNQGVIIPTFSSSQDKNKTNSFHDDNLSEHERALCFKLFQFPESIERVARGFEPNFLCNYLYELGQTFNQFYENCRVLGNEREQDRLLFCVATRTVLSKGLQILHVTSLERI